MTPSNRETTIPSLFESFCSDVFALHLILVATIVHLAPRCSVVGCSRASWRASAEKQEARYQTLTMVADSRSLSDGLPVGGCDGHSCMEMVFRDGELRGVMEWF